MSKIRFSPKSDQDTSWIFWIVMCFVCGSFIIAPFYRAMFNGGQYVFERPIFIFTTWSAVALVAIAFYLFKHWKLNSQTDLMALAGWLIPLCYLISTINAASHYLALQEVYLHIAYVIFFLVGVYFSRSNFGAAILQYALIVTGYVIVIHGLLNWFGNVRYFEAVLGNQLAGVFQYPNTYSAFLIGILIVLLIYINNSNKWYLTLPHALMLVPIGVSIFLTLSRGGMVILPVALLLYMIWLPWRKQLFTLLYLMIAVGVGLAVNDRLTSIQAKISHQFVASESLKGWAIVIILSIIVSGLVVVIQKYIAFPQVQKHQENRVFTFKNFVIPISALLLGLIGLYLVGNQSVVDKLPSSIAQRINSINSDDSSIAQRVEFYKDSLKILMDYPLIGAGGGAWASLYNQYKGFPYTSAQTHTVISQVLVDTGIIGFVIFISFLGLCWFLFIRSVNKRQYSNWNEKQLVLPLFGATILLHSLLDFDLSFVYLSALLYLSLGTLVSNLDKVEIPNALKGINKISKVYPTLVLIIAIVVFVISFQSFRADKFFKQAQIAANTTHNYEDIITPLNSALELQKNHPFYNLFKVGMLVDLYGQTKDEKFSREAAEILQKVQEKELDHRRVIELQIALLINKGDYVGAAEWIIPKLKTNPWDIGLYEKAITLNFDAGNQARLQSDKTKMTYYWKKSLEVFEMLTKKINEFQALPTSQKTGFTFDLTSRIVLTIGEIHFISGNYQEATQLLRSKMSGDIANPTEREITRWYIASQFKQNLNDDTGLYQQLIQEDPSEEEKIKNITNINQM